MSARNGREPSIMPSIPHRKLGGSGPQVPTLSLGTWQWERLGQADVNRIVFAAFDSGISVFDTSDTYGGGRVEEMLGAAIRHLPRSEIIIATKTGIYRRDAVEGTGGNVYLGADQLRAGLYGSLRRLRIDEIDILQLQDFNPFTPLERIATNLNAFQREGLVQHLGVCGFGPLDLRALQRCFEEQGWTLPCCGQWMCNIVAGNGAAATLRDQSIKIGVMGFSPLAEGLLVRRVDADLPASRAATPRFQRLWAVPGSSHLLMKLGAIAQNLALPLSELCLVWALRQKGVTTIVMGARSAEQVRANTHAWSVSISDQTLAAIDRARRETHIGFWDD